MNRSTAIAALLLAAGTAHATILQWDALFNGSASTATNWNPNQVPTATDDLRFNATLNNNYTVTYDSIVPTVRSHQYLGDNVRLRVTNAAGHTVTSTFSIENGSNVTIETGTVSVGGTASVGSASGAGGALTVDQGTLAPLVLRAGPIGPGEVTVSNGGRITATTIEVNGPASMLVTDTSVATASTVRVGGSTSASTSTFAIEGGSNLGAQTIELAPVANSFATCTIQSDASDAFASVNAGALRIAANTNPAAAGTATFECRNGSGPSPARVSCSSIFVGDPDGGHGTLRISGGIVECNTAHFVAGHSALVVGGFGFTCRDDFQWDNGDLSLDFGTHANAVCRFEGLVTMPAALRIAPTASGSVELLTSTGSMTVPGTTVIGGSAGSSGSLLVGNSAEATFAQLCTVGQSGSGSLTVSGGSDATFADLRIAANSTSAGTLTLDQSFATVSAGLSVGGTVSLAGGSGVASVSSSRLTVTGTTRIWGNGLLRVTDGSGFLSSSPVTTAPGAQIEVTDSTVRAESISLTGAASAAADGADMTASGTVDAAISASGFGNNITANGPLAIGGATSTAGFSGANIALDVGAHTVTLRDANTASVSSVAMAAGTLAAANGLTLNSGGTISGGGIIDAPSIVNSGSINATTPQGFVLRGLVTGTGTLTGTIFDFSNTGGFTGTGTINSQIRGTAGSVITSTGALSLGTASTIGFSFDGTLRVGSNTVTLHDTSTAFVGNVELAGGTLFCTDTDMSSDLGDVTSGFGTIGVTPRTWITAGTVRPNGSGSDVTGQLSVAGNVNAENVFNSALFDMDIGGTTTSNIDRFVVVGALTIDGTLRVRFVPGYVPAGGELYTVITANSIAGNFTSLDLPPRTRAIVNPTNVQVEALCTSDQNADGTVDGDDVIDLFAAWDLGLPEADTNGDGSVDGDDVIVFFEHWDAGC